MSKVINCRLVKMDSTEIEYVATPPAGEALKDGQQPFPDNPEVHPDCIEILEGPDMSNMKTVYRR